jgi:hypothetical protein
MNPDKALRSGFTAMRAEEEGAFSARAFSIKGRSAARAREALKQGGALAPCSGFIKDV